MSTATHRTAPTLHHHKLSFRIAFKSHFGLFPHSKIELNSNFYRIKSSQTRWESWKWSELSSTADIFPLASLCVWAQQLKCAFEFNAKSFWFTNARRRERRRWGMSVCCTNVKCKMWKRHVESFKIQRNVCSAVMMTVNGNGIFFGFWNVDVKLLLSSFHGFSSSLFF